MRIVAGTWAGKALTSPGKRVRATAEDVRDAWLTVLEPSLPGARVLDLFAGSGALGLEALSRGAASADFVEDGAEALHALKANVTASRLHAPKPGSRPDKRRKTARIFKRDAIPFVQGLDEGAYDIAFADPPYGSRKLDLIVRHWFNVPFATILGVEHAAAQPVPPGGMRLEFGETAVTVYGVRSRGRGNVGLHGKSPTIRSGKSLSRSARKPLQDRARAACEDWCEREGNPRSFGTRKTDPALADSRERKTRRTCPPSTQHQRAYPWLAM